MNNGDGFTIDLSSKNDFLSSGSCPLEMDVNNCQICFEEFLYPYILPCGHSFCLPCLGEMKVWDGGMKCPSCRGDITFVIPNFHLNKSDKSYTADQQKIKDKLDGFNLASVMSRPQNSMTTTSASSYGYAASSSSGPWVPDENLRCQYVYRVGTKKGTRCRGEAENGGPFCGLCTRKKFIMQEIRSRRVTESCLR